MLVTAVHMSSCRPISAGDVPSNLQQPSDTTQIDAGSAHRAIRSRSYSDRVVHVSWLLIRTPKNICLVVEVDPAVNQAMPRN